MFARSRARRNRQKNLNSQRKQQHALQQARSPRPRRKHQNLEIKKNKDFRSETDNRSKNNYYDIKEATAFICEFDQTVENFQQAERKISRDDDKCSNRKSQATKEPAYDLEKFLKETKIGKTQKQALLLILLCYDADFPESMFSKLCESVTMKKIMDKMLDGEHAARLLIDIDRA